VDKQRELYRVVTHPFLLSKTALWKHVDQETLLEYCKSNKVVEVSNGSFWNIRSLIEKRGWKGIFKKLLIEINKLEHWDIYTWEFKSKVKFSWSDAHHIVDIGNHTIIHTNKSENNKLFTSLLSPNIEKTTYINEKSLFNSLIWLTYMTFTVFFERAIKTFYIYKLRDE